MSKTNFLKTLEVSLPNLKTEKEKTKLKERESSVKNVADLDTFKRNIPISIEIKRMDIFPHC